MPNYIHYDYNQSSMVVVNFLDQLQPGTFEHAVHYLVDHKLDLGSFDATFKNEKKQKKTGKTGETGEKQGHIWSTPYCKKKFVGDEKNIAPIYPALG